MAGEAPVPGLAHAFDMEVRRGPAVTVGQLAIGGRRSHVPVAGGLFEGEGLSCRLVGGGETLFARADGVTVIEASYYIESETGAVARAFGTGYRTSGGDFTGTRMTLLFEAEPDGPLAFLAGHAFVAEELPGSPRIAIARIV